MNGAAFLCYVTPAEHLALPNVEVVWNHVVKEIQGMDQVEALLLENAQTGAEQKLAVDGCFIAVGILPNSELVQ